MIIGVFEDSKLIARGSWKSNKSGQAWNRIHTGEII